MKEQNEKKQVATIWLLTVLIIILIALIIGLVIIYGKSRRQGNLETADKSQQETMTEKTESENVSTETASTTGNNKVGLEGMYGYENGGDVIYRFSKTGKVTRSGNVSEEIGTYTYVTDNEILISFNEISTWDELTGKTTKKTIDRKESIKIAEDGKLIDESEYKLVQIEEENAETDKYSEITNTLIEDEVLFVTSATKNTDNTYTLKGVIYKLYTLTEDEMESIKSKGSFTLARKTYKVKKNTETEDWELYMGSNTEPSYIIETIGDEEYRLTSCSQYSNVYKITSIKKQITVGGDITCEYNYGEATVKDEFENFKAKEADAESIFPLPFYSFTFENGKCVSVFAEHGQ